MKKLYDEILIVDVESTCWDKYSMFETQVPEIIEIGICLLNIQDLTISKKRSILVKPMRSKVSEFCTQLTTLTQEQVDTGIKFESACMLISKEYNSYNRSWASWGDYDRKQFMKQHFYPFGPRHLNIKHLFTLKHRLSKEVGMKEALDILNMPLEGTHHRGVDDAYNIAKIMRSILED